jgi:hypothetical protein
LANFCLQAFLAANYHVPRHWVFFIPSFVIFALWIGEGLGTIWLGVERIRNTNAKVGTALTIALALAMLTLPLLSFREYYQPLRESHLGAGILDVWRQQLKQGLMAERIGRAVAGVEQDAVIVSDWEQATPLWYYQQVEGWRPDVQIICPVERLGEAAATGQPLYITRNHPGLTDRWHPSSSGPLIWLRPEPTPSLPSEIIPVGLQLGDSFELAGFVYGKSNFHPSSAVPLTIYWRALQAPVHDYSVSLRLLDEAGQEIFKVDSQHPVLGTYPTSKWIAGEVVGDYYEIQLPGDLLPGAYQWGVILYRSLSEDVWENLKVAGTDSEMAMGGTFQVQKR